MPSSTLGPTSHIVLGLLALQGPATSYELNALVDESIGSFWQFPRSQLYAEPRRLAERGLVSESQEAGGRRRRTYTITDAGRGALEAWLRSPAGFPELRDGGLLRLFFADLVDEDAVHALADEQLRLHRERLAGFEHLIDTGRAEGLRGATATLRMGVYYERAEIAFWSELRGAQLDARAEAEAPAAGSTAAGAVTRLSR